MCEGVLGVEGGWRMRRKGRRITHKGGRTTHCTWGVKKYRNIILHYQCILYKAVLAIIDAVRRCEIDEHNCALICSKMSPQLKRASCEERCSLPGSHPQPLNPNNPPSGLPTTLFPGPPPSLLLASLLIHSPNHSLSLIFPGSVPFVPAFANPL